MNVFNLPVKTVIEDGIFPYLHWTDFLELRKVCKAAKMVVNEFLWQHPHIAPEIRISESDEEGGCTLEDFMRIDIPSTKIFLNNVNHPLEMMFVKEGKATLLEQFLKKYGSVITQVRVKKLTLCSEDSGFTKEHEFWEGLTSLKRVETVLIDCAYSFWKRTVIHVPETFKGLQSLKVSVLSDDLSTRKGIKYFQDFLTACESLEEFSVPRITKWNMPLANEMRLRLCCCLLDLEPIVVGHATTLKKIDVKGLSVFGEDILRNATAAEGFRKLSKVCLSNSVRLFSVPVLLLQEAQKQAVRQRYQIGKTVTSTSCADVVELAIILRMDLPNLEELEVESTNDCINSMVRLAERPRLPMLKSLSVNMTRASGRDALCFFKFFLDQDPYPNLTEVRWIFSNYARFYYDQSIITKQYRGRLIKSCASVKRLTLVSWYGNNAALANLCEGMNGLEELLLVEPVKEVNDQAFLVTKEGHPILLNIESFQRKLTDRSNLGMMRMRSRDIALGEVLSLLKGALLKLKKPKKSDPTKLITSVGLKTMLGRCFTEVVKRCPTGEWSEGMITEIPCWEMKMLARMLQAALQL